MSIYPDAIWRPLPENRTEPRIRPKLAIWHSAVDHPGPTSLWGFFRHSTSLESHFFIQNDGTVEQYIDTHRQADANYKANGFWRSGQYWGAVSVETEDDGDPNNKRWTSAQAESSVKLGEWLVEEHGIPPVLCPAWNEPGFGYHSQFPGIWTPYKGKTCPGTIRIPQFLDEILPAIERNSGGFMAALSDDEQKALAFRVNVLFDALNPRGVPSMAKVNGTGIEFEEPRPVADLYRWTAEGVEDTRELIVRMVALQESIDALTEALAGERVVSLRLGIDLDGVVCDFARWANSWLAQELDCKPIPVDRWDWYRAYEGDVESCWERLWAEEVPDNGFFFDVSETPGAIDGLDVLRTLGHQLVFITSRPATAGVDTGRWLESRGLGGHHLILSLSAKAKQFTDTDVLLDDKGDTVLRHLRLNKSAVLFKRPWNREWWHRVPSVSGWPEFVQLVEKLDEEVGDAGAAR